MTAASLSIRLPAADGRARALRPARQRAVRHAAAEGGFQPHRLLGRARRRRSAAHATDPWVTAALDWDATIAYRQRLWSLGLGVAEAMDTAQRGMGLDWPTSLELIRRSLDAARDHAGALVASGCGTDHLAPDAATSVDDVIRAYEKQMEAIEAARRQADRDGEPGAGAGRHEPGRLRTRLRPHPHAVEGSR